MKYVKVIKLYIIVTEIKPGPVLGIVKVYIFVSCCCCCCCKCLFSQAVIYLNYVTIGP